MSKIGKKPIQIPNGVTVSKKDGILDIKGKNGELTVLVLPFLDVEVSDKEISIKTNKNHKQARSNWGTMAANVKNALAGAVNSFEKKLEIQGIGFKANMEGKLLVLNLGFSHPVKFTPPEGVKIVVEKSIITIAGPNKQLVGQTAAEIRKLKKPEPYLGKGIRYVDERVRRKEGKKAAGATAA